MKILAKELNFTYGFDEITNVALLVTWQCEVTLVKTQEKKNIFYVYYL